MYLRATPVASERLRTLPTPARRVVDGADVVVPPGFEVEPLVVGLSFPCGMGFADDNPLAPFPLPTETGPFKPFGDRAKQGEVVKGEL
jgi:hypothetical protein